MALSSNKAIVSGVAGRYSIALFDLAKDAKALDVVKADLDQISVLLNECAEFATVVTSPVMGRDEKVKAVAAVAKKAKFNDLIGKFLGVLATNGRLDCVGATINGYAKLLADHRGEVSADVISAQPLSKKQTDDLQKKLKAIIGQDVTFEARVDETLLGGLIVKVGSRMVDFSLKSKLANLKVSMKGV